MPNFARNDQGDYRPGFGGFSFFPPVIKNLILINVGMFILQNLFISGFLTIGGNPLADWFVETFYLMPFGQGFQVWQLGTYMFLHGGMSHIFLNMLMLWMFGMEVENTWGSQKFLVFYLTAGLVAGLANLFIAPLFTVPGPTIGASGGVYGVLVAFAMMFPNRYVFIYFLFPVRAKYLITFFIMLELFNGVTGTSEGVAHIAHLGGAMVGALFVILDARGVIDRLLGGVRRRSRTPSRSGASSGEHHDARFFDIRDTRKERDAMQDTARNMTRDVERQRTASQKIIDDILDKISISGYASLTDREKQILLDASRTIHPDKDQR